MPLAPVGVTVCFASDLHGNERHLERVCLTAMERKADVLILGGDIAPRGHGNISSVDDDGTRWFGAGLTKDEHGNVDWSTPEALRYQQKAYDHQAKWFSNVLVPTLARLSIPSLVLFGNSDWKGCMCVCTSGAALVNKEAGFEKIRILDGEGDIVTIETLAKKKPNGGSGGEGSGGENGGITPVATCRVLGLSLVPMCSHLKKDWERIDTRDIATTMQRAPHLSPVGFVSGPDGAVRRSTAELTPEAADMHSIEVALERLLASAKNTKSGASASASATPQSPTTTLSVPELWVCHGPPYMTIGDLTSRGERVGSVALRNAIEKYAPACTIHGHIHESVSLHSGAFGQKLKGDHPTAVFSVGHVFTDSAAHCIVVDTGRPHSGERVKC